MASKVIYTVAAVAGIATASCAAWWYQKPKPAGQGVSAAAAGASQGTASGSPAAKAAADRPVVEAVKVEVVRLTDDTQAVGSCGRGAAS